MVTIDERKGLLRAICTAPNDDMPRQAFADWLDRFGTYRGDAAHAALIRIQLECEAVHASCGCEDCIRRFRGGQRHNSGRCLLLRGNRSQMSLARREMSALHAAIRFEAFGSLLGPRSWRAYPSLIDGIPLSVWVRRGFLDTATCYADQWARYCPRCSSRGLLWIAEAACRLCRGTGFYSQNPLALNAWRSDWTTDPYSDESRLPAFVQPLRCVRLIGVGLGHIPAYQKEWPDLIFESIEGFYDDADVPVERPQRTPPLPRRDQR